MKIISPLYRLRAFVIAGRIRSTDLLLRVGQAWQTPGGHFRLWRSRDASNDNSVISSTRCLNFL